MCIKTSKMFENKENKYSLSYVSNAVDVDKELKTFPECLRYYADTRPDYEAYVFVGDNGERLAITWSELYVKSCNMATGFIKLGLKLGDVVCVCIKICPQNVYSIFGVILAGGICCPVPSSLVDNKGDQLIEYIQQLENCVGLVIDPTINDNAAAVTDRMVKSLESSDNSLQFVVVPESYNKVDHRENVDAIEKMIEGVDAGIPLPDLDEEDIAYLLGSNNNADPKKLCGQIHAFNGTIFSYSKTSAMFVYGEMLFTLNYGFPHHVRGGLKIVTLLETSNGTTDTLTRIINAVVEENCVMVSISESLTYELISRKAEIPNKWPMKIFLSGGRLNNNTHRELFGKISYFVETPYFNKELGGVTYDATTSLTYKEFSVGYLREGLQLKIVDKDGTIQPIGCRGELYLQSTRSFPLYYIDRERNKRIRDNNGWIKTGDDALMEEDGRIFVYGKI